MITLACICGGVLEIAAVTALAATPVGAWCFSCVKKHIVKKKEEDCGCECHEEETS
jgi:hypothetical protein